MKLTPEEVQEQVRQFRLSPSYFLGELSTRKLRETLVRKVAIGYPPAPEMYASVTVPEDVRSHPHLFSKGDLELSRMWYEVQSEFNNPKFVEYIHRHKRTRKWQRPSVDYICRVLQVTPDLLKVFVFDRYLRPGLLGPSALRCPVPEWVQIYPMQLCLPSVL